MAVRITIWLIGRVMRRTVRVLSPVVAVCTLGRGDRNPTFGEKARRGTRRRVDGSDDKHRHEQHDLLPATDPEHVPYEEIH